MNNLATLIEAKKQEHRNYGHPATEDWKFGFLYGYIEGLKCATEAITQPANKEKE